MIDLSGDRTTESIGEEIVSRLLLDLFLLSVIDVAGEMVDHLMDVDPEEEIKAGRCPTGAMDSVCPDCPFLKLEE